MYFRLKHILYHINDIERLIHNKNILPPSIQYCLQQIRPIWLCTYNHYNSFVSPLNVIKHCTRCSLHIHSLHRAALHLLNEDFPFKFHASSLWCNICLDVSMWKHSLHVYKEVKNNRIDKMQNRIYECNGFFNFYAKQFE